MVLKVGGARVLQGGGGHQQKKKINKTVNKGRNLEWEMDRFVKGKRKAIDEVAQTQAGAVHSKAKCRKYDGACILALGFTHRTRVARLAPQQLYTGRDNATVVNHFNFVSVRHN